MKYRLSLLVLIFSIILFSCDKTATGDTPSKEIVPPKPKVVKEYGYILENYAVHRDTVRSGDSFGKILFDANVDYGTIEEITDTVQSVFDTRRIRVGKPYMLLKSKDTLDKAQVFIYEQNIEDYVVIDFQDKVIAEAKKHPTTVYEREISGVINSNLSSTFDDLGVSANVAYKMADIYAWTIDFFKLQKGDRFKLIYDERFVNDSIPTGVGKIKACIFEHSGKEIYAFRFENDSLPGGFDFFDQNGKNLRRAFLKGPLKFNRISSRYNLKRRIKYYGYKLRPHKGTDFAGPIGTPILATSDGVIIKSERKGGNGNYVKIRHNATYETQYLHMQRRAVKVGDFVKQGDVIGTIGMTGNSGGPHVCYRFWKNGKQVDPFKEELPSSKTLDSIYLPAYDSIRGPLEKRLENISWLSETEMEVIMNEQETEGNLEL